ncbi:AAA family ATPase [Priestia megaterium]|uniref:AAA family ATPase n=1 Tax=Priestia megaterium TaxID=1404 RepID=UPI002E1A763B|nr:AAA family ATPase [Priestia megaterium]
MRLSHSRVETFNKCPYQFKLKYIDGLETLPTDDPASPLVIGHALHTGIEKDVESAIEEYYSAFPIITDRHIEEALKLEYWLPKIKEAIPAGGLHEIEIADGDNFIGFIDYLVPVDEHTYDLYDWKYSNNVDSYSKSGQLHEYKYYFEKLHPDKKIRNMYFMFVPKCSIRIKYKNKRNKRDETLSEFRKRIYADLDSKQLQFVKIDYSTDKVIEFLDNGIHAINCVEYKKNPTRLCDWCDFKKYCERKDDVDMALPSTQRRTIEGNNYKKIWFYGMPFSGKTFLANKFETPLMLNTDGNFKQVDAPVLRIMDEVTTEGRITKRKYAWEVFKEAVDDLEKGSEFKTIIVDLLEDVYDACRVKVCVDNGWDHESDDSFKAYDIVRSEFLRTLKRLINLDYNIILISHEDTSKDITKKTGDKITAIKPNLSEKIALKVAGMVDIACRIVNDEGKRTIRFKSSEVEFGGGRLTINAKEIPCEYADLMKVYGAPAPKAEKKPEPAKPAAVPDVVEMPVQDDDEPPFEIIDDEPTPVPVEEPAPAPAPRKRRRRTEE